MINLLSLQKKKEVRNILFGRFLNGLFFVMFFILILLIVSLVPIYSHLRSQESEVENLNNSLSINSNFNQIKNTFDIINASNEKLKVFPDNLPENGYIESTLNKIISLKGQVKIKSFKYTYLNKPDSKSTNIEISGTAVNREALLDFKQKLESEKTFSNIVLPVSSFVKVDNIEFNIRLLSN